MRADRITQVAQSAEGETRDVHHRKRRGARFHHPRGQQDSATVRAVHYKMDHARMNKTPNRHDPPSGERMMRIFNDDIDEVAMTTGPKLEDEDQFVLRAVEAAHAGIWLGPDAEIEHLQRRRPGGGE